MILETFLSRIPDIACLGFSIYFLVCHWAWQFLFSVTLCNLLSFVFLSLMVG